MSRRSHRGASEGSAARQALRNFSRIQISRLSATEIGGKIDRRQGATPHYFNDMGIRRTEARHVSVQAYNCQAARMKFNGSIGRAIRIGETAVLSTSNRGAAS
jgi:hypothetical protein